MNETIILAEKPFAGFQGEGASQGKHSLFIRFKTCNLACKFCFGIKPGRRNPKVLAKNKSNLSLDKVEVDDVLLTFNSKGEMVETTVINTMNREVTLWYELKINNTLYYVTPEHELFTNKGLKQVKDLKPGDMILHANSYQKNSFLMKHYNPMFNEDIKQKSINNTDYQAQGTKLSNTLQKQKKEGTYTPAWYKLSNEKQQQLRKAYSVRQQGSNNSNYNPNRTDRNFINEVNKLKNKSLPCQRCGTITNKLVIHHKDGNHDNDCLDNFERLCHKCHNKEHKRGYNFWNSNRKDHKVSSTGAELVNNGYEVETIREINILNHPHYGKSYGPKPLKVYNISCEPYNTYIIDYMWSHNCDSKYANNGEQGFKIAWDELVHLMKKSTNVIFTGGEPLLQIDTILKLMAEVSSTTYCSFEIETNGTVNLDDSQLAELLDYAVTFNVSPKLNITQEGLVDTTPVLLKNNDFINSVFAYCVKLLLEVDSDINYIKQFQAEYEIEDADIYVQPVGVTREEIYDGVIKYYDEIIKNNWNLSSRLHVLFFNDKRGV